MRTIAGNNDAGGLFALAFFTTGKASSRSVISGPGNSDVAKAEIDTFVNDHPDAKVFVAGHSDGAGDVQNLLWKLKTLGVYRPVAPPTKQVQSETVTSSVLLDAAEPTNGTATTQPVHHCARILAMPLVAVPYAFATTAK